MTSFITCFNLHSYCGPQIYDYAKLQSVLPRSWSMNIAHTYNRDAKVNARFLITLQPQSINHSC